jgi:hypothetical protein
MQAACHSEAHADLLYARGRRRDSACSRGTNPVRAIKEAQAALALASGEKARLEEAIAAGLEALERRIPLDEETRLRVHVTVALLEDAMSRVASDIARARRAEASARKAAIEARKKGLILWS